MNTLTQALVAQIANQLDAQGESNPMENLRLIAEQFAGKAIFLSNFTLEDQLITHWIAIHNLPIKVVVSNPNYPFTETLHHLGPDSGALWLADCSMFCRRADHRGSQSKSIYPGCKQHRK